MNRREFLAAWSGSLLAAPASGEAQPAAKIRSLGFLFGNPPTAPAGQEPFFEPFYARLSELGWVYGRDFVTERRSYGDQ